MDTLYLKLKQKTQVSGQKAILSDIADLICTDPARLARLQAMPIASFSGSKKQRKILTVTTIIGKIQKIYPDLSVSPLGETEMIVEYDPKKPPSAILTWAKIALVCLLCFFGAAFTIITFNNDVSAGSVFEGLYKSFTGQESNGITVLEITYSIGLALGILCFFNHFSGHRLTTDPTPIEVEMEKYEYDVNKSLISYDSRKDAKNASETNSSGSGGA